LGRAYLLAQSGDTVLVAGGSYGSQQLLFDPGKGSEPVTFRAAPGQTVMINGVLELGGNCGGDCGAPPHDLVLDGISASGGLRTWYNGGKGADNLLIENAKYASGVGLGGGAGITLSSTRNVTVRNVEIGPMCCGSLSGGFNSLVGIVLGKGEATPNPANITIDRVYIHDIERKGAYWPASGYGPPPAPDCPTTYDSCHGDGIQAYGGDNITIKNSRFYNNNSQQLFLGTANGGTFSNWTIENNMISSPSEGGSCGICGSAAAGVAFSGFFHIYYNSLAPPGAQIRFTPAAAINPSANFDVRGNIGIHPQPCALAGTWSYRYNLWWTGENNDTCGPGDILGVDVAVQR